MLRVAGLLYLDPSSGRSLGELTKAMPDIKRLTVIRALNELVGQGYLTKSIGSPPLYRANPKHFLFDEMRSIAAKTFGGFEAMALRIAESDAVSYAAIYGSFARGNARPDSDIDLLLVATAASDPDLTAVVSELASAARSVGREINPTIYDQAEFEARKGSRFLSEILAGPLLVLKDSA